MLKLFAFSQYRFDSDKKVVALLKRLEAGPLPPVNFDLAEPIRRKLEPEKHTEVAEILAGTGEGGTLFLSSKKPQSTFVFRWMPSITAEWYGEFEEGILRRKGGREAIVDFFVGFFREFPVVFAGLAPEEDWDAKHWIVEEDDEGGELVTKVGLSLDTCLPGVYWITVFGTELVAHFGRDALLSAPNYVAVDIGDQGVVLISKADPLKSDRAERAAHEDSVVRTLGAEYFFDPTQPFRECTQIPNLISASRD